METSKAFKIFSMPRVPVVGGTKSNLAKTTLHTRRWRKLPWNEKRKRHYVRSFVLKFLVQSLCFE
jgi:hypothetical protein